MFFQNQNRPMTPEEVARLRDQIEGREMNLAAGNYAPNIGGGLHALGDGIALNVMRRRMNNHFPAPPSAQNATAALAQSPHAPAANRFGGLLRGLMGLF